MVDDGDGFPQDQWSIITVVVGENMMQTGNVSEGREGGPVRLAEAPGFEVGQLLLEGDVELAHEEPGAEAPGGVVSAGDVQMVGHSTPLFSSSSSGDPVLYSE